MRFHEVLSDLRYRSGKRQRQVAADLGISQALLSHYENGTREPGLAFLLCRESWRSAGDKRGRDDLGRIGLEKICWMNENFGK